MARHKDRNWRLPEGKKGRGGVTTHSWNSIHASLLMDIRDELMRINAALHGADFADIPKILRGIRRKVPTPTPAKRSSPRTSEST